MLYYVKTSSGDCAFDDNERSASDPAKDATALARLQAAKEFFEQRRNVKWAQASGTQLTALAALRTLISAPGMAAIKAMRLRRGVQADGRTPLDIDLSSATYACAWDGVAPHVTTLFGTLPPLTQQPVTWTDGQGRQQSGVTWSGGIPIAGWPQTDLPPDPPVPPTQAQIDAANAAAAAKAAAQEQWRVDAQAQMQLGIPAYQAWVAAHPYPQ